MKKRLMLTVFLLVTLLVLCSCTFIPTSKLGTLFTPQEGSVITSGDLTQIPGIPLPSAGKSMRNTRSSLKYIRFLMLQT